MKAQLCIAALSLAVASFDSGADAAIERGKAELKPFKQQLMAALKAGLTEGPARAIDACRIDAPAIADGLTMEQVQVGRTSHRLRNPDNAGPAWATAVLDEYLAEEGEWLPRRVKLADQRVGYVEPIVTQPLCLACHGTALAAPVAEALTTHYPEDRATDFAVGDLRGVFWVSFETEPGENQKAQ